MENIIVMIIVMKMTATQPATIMNSSAKTHIIAYSCMLCSSLYLDLQVLDHYVHFFSVKCCNNFYIEFFRYD
jgi:predicted SprT family Zn-dependent metalloprotease